MDIFTHKKNSLPKYVKFIIIIIIFTELNSFKEENQELIRKQEELEKIALKYKQTSAQFESNSKNLAEEIKTLKEDLDKSHKKVQSNELCITELKKGKIKLYQLGKGI